MQAKAGQLIVGAIEAYKRQSGSYPASLDELAPIHRPTIPGLRTSAGSQFEGWQYQIVTNRVTVSYRLSFYLGRGGIEYQTPNWVGNDEGRLSVIMRNE